MLYVDLLAEVLFRKVYVRYKFQIFKINHMGIYSRCISAENSHVCWRYPIIFNCLICAWSWKIPQIQWRHLLPRMLIIYLLRFQKNKSKGLWRSRRAKDLKQIKQCHCWHCLWRFNYKQDLHTFPVIVFRWRFFWANTNIYRHREW